MQWKKGGVLLSLLGLFGGIQSDIVPVEDGGDLERVNIRLEGIREKCLVEELPGSTVVLGNNHKIV